MIKTGPCIALLLVCNLFACDRRLPTQTNSGSVDTISAKTAMKNSDIEANRAKLYSEHGHDRRSAIAWFCAHSEAGRPILRSFFQPLEEEWAAEAALEALGCIGHPEDVPLLDSVLASGKLAYQAGFSLASNPSPAAFVALMKRSEDENEAVARGAIGGLGERKEEAARSHLEALLKHSRSNIRWAAVLALADLGVKPSEKALRDCALVETDPDVRDKIMEQLKETTGHTPPA